MEANRPQTAILSHFCGVRMTRCCRVSELASYSRLGAHRKDLTARCGACIALATVGVVLWGTAVIGVARYAEDICLDDFDGRPEYGAYRTGADLWPPWYECNLLGNDVEPVVVQHRGVALARLGAIVVFPVAYAIAPHSALCFGAVAAAPASEHRGRAAPRTHRPLPFADR